MRGSRRTELPELVGARHRQLLPEKDLLLVGVRCVQVQHQIRALHLQISHLRNGFFRGEARGGFQANGEVEDVGLRPKVHGSVGEHGLTAGGGLQLAAHLVMHVSEAMQRRRHLVDPLQQGAAAPVVVLAIWLPGEVVDLVGRHVSHQDVGVMRDPLPLPRTLLLAGGRPGHGAGGPGAAIDLDPLDRDALIHQQEAIAPRGAAQQPSQVLKGNLVQPQLVISRHQHFVAVR
mmetsp:Transcript_136576/g.323511  ORF Transcript_136576/g.323511 Transcript_136576/m.323511 type:complete len:232 (+) Transcript_136576:352-1047(+)